jgi:hypothetical protein
MQENDSYPTQDGPANVDDYPLSVRFAARRALLNAQIQAKITESSYKLEPFPCGHPGVSKSITYLLNTDEEDRKGLE